MLLFLVVISVLCLLCVIVCGCYRYVVSVISVIVFGCRCIVFVIGYLFVWFCLLWLYYVCGFVVL